MNKENSKEEELEKEIEEEKESELEKEIEEEEVIEAEKESKENESLEFEEFIQQPSIESSAPILKEIESKESLEQDIASIPIVQETKKDEKEIKYSQKYGETDYKKIKEERTEENRILKTTPVILEPRRIELHQEQEFRFTPNITELQGGDLDEDYVIKTGRIEQEHRLPFERQKKYD